MSPFPSFKLLSFGLKTSLLLWVSDSKTTETEEERPIYLRRHQINCCLSKSRGPDEDEYVSPHRAETSLVCTWKETEKMEGTFQFLTHKDSWERKSTSFMILFFSTDFPLSFFPTFCNRGRPKPVLLSVNNKHQ